MATRNGRKYNMGLIAMLAVFAGFAACAFVPALIGVAGVYTGGILGAYAIYCGGNVSNKWVTVKAQPEPPPPEDTLRGVH
jgi:hypothetical protein